MQMWLSFFILFTLMSCQKNHLVKATDFNPRAHEIHEIINGKVVSFSEAVASHVAIIFTTTTEGSSEVCTGVFVTKDQILTAKHCISEDISSMSVSFRGSTYDRDLNVTDLPILSVHFFKAEGRNDLALLKLQTPSELQNRPVELSPSIHLHNTDVLLVGYGIGSVLGYDSQTLRKKLISATVLDLTKNTFVLEQSQGGICFGDSGGPVLYFDSRLRKYFLVGIASGVIQGAATNPCLNQSVVMNILFYKNQIQEIL
jgi:hypothetical protein